MKKPGQIPGMEVRLERASGVGAELRERLREMIVRGRLKRGARLPSSRALAARLGVSRNTVLFAYEELAADGVIGGRVGSGTRVRTEAWVAGFSDPDGLKLECVGTAQARGNPDSRAPGRSRD